LRHVFDRVCNRAVTVADFFDPGYEAISTPRQCLDVARRVGIVVEHLAQLLDMRVQAVLEVNKGILRPEMTPEFLAGHQLAGPVEEKRKHSDRLALDLELQAAFPELGRPLVEFEGCKTELLYALDWQMYPTVANAAHPARIKGKNPLGIWTRVEVAWFNPKAAKCRDEGQGADRLLSALVP